MQQYPFANVTNTFGANPFGMCAGNDHAAEAMIQQLAMLAYYAQAYNQPHYANQDIAPYRSNPFTERGRPTESYLMPVARVVPPAQPDPYAGFASYPQPQQQHAPPHKRMCECIHCERASTAEPHPLQDFAPLTPPRQGLKHEDFQTPQQPLRPSKDTTPSDSIGYSTPHTSAKNSATKQPKNLPLRATPANAPRTAKKPAITAASKSTKEPRFVLTVQGHHETMYSVFSHDRFRLGDHVVFDGDRGTDLGCVCVVEALEVGQHPSGGAHVLREATTEEVGEWNSRIVENEHKAVERCRAAVKNLGLQLTVHHAVFQFDQQKLTFFYEARERVDFRQLLHQMYQEFRCRIWMTRVNEENHGPSALTP